VIRGLGDVFRSVVVLAGCGRLVCGVYGSWCFDLLCGGGMGMVGCWVVFIEEL